MTALVETHAQHSFPGLEEREVHTHVGLGPGVGLDIGVLRPEELLGPIDGQLLHLVDHRTALVVAPARVALGVLVGEDRTRGGHHRGRGEVLRGDEVDVGVLPFDVFADEAGDCGVDLLQGVHRDHGPRVTR